MSPLSPLSVSIISAFTLPQDESGIFARADPPPASSSSAPQSSAASSAAPASSASATPSATSGNAAPTNLPNVSSTTAAPAVTSSGAAGITASFPSLTNGQVYSYPAPTVPPTLNAPFMQKSTLPNGTVFICVGAIIGGFFVAVFIWRAWAVWALHRRMNAANVEFKGVASAAPTVTGSGLGHDRKSTVLRKSGTGFYSQGGAGSGYNMGELPKKSSDYHHRSQRNAATDYSAVVGGSGITKGAAAARQSNLFFSPTAGAGAHGSAAQRASSYLPAGFYAAGSTAAVSTVVNANSTSDLTTNPSRSQLSMADFNPPSRNTYGYKDSPVLTPQAGTGLEPPNAPFGRHSMGRASTSSVGTGNSERAPSAYLEDLFNTNPTESRGSDERRRF